MSELVKLKWGEQLTPSIHCLPLMKLPNFHPEGGRLFILDKNGILTFPNKAYTMPLIGAALMTGGYVNLALTSVGVAIAKVQSADDIEFDLDLEMQVKAKNDLNAWRRIAVEQDELDKSFELCARSVAAAYFKTVAFSKIQQMDPASTSGFIASLASAVSTKLPYELVEALPSNVRADPRIVAQLKQRAAEAAAADAIRATLKIKTENEVIQSELLSNAEVQKLDHIRTVAAVQSRNEHTARMQELQDMQQAASERERLLHQFHEEHFESRKRRAKLEAELDAELARIDAEAKAQTRLLIAGADLEVKKLEAKQDLEYLTAVSARLRDLPSDEFVLDRAIAFKLIGLGADRDVVMAALDGSSERNRAKHELELQVAKLQGAVKAEQIAMRNWKDGAGFAKPEVIQIHSTEHSLGREEQNDSSGPESRPDVDDSRF